MTEGMTVVLGWDALDSELLDSFGIGDAFGQHRKRIETFDNPILEEPHTRELWPSIITGKRPEEHGVWAAEEGGGIQWDNPVIDRLSTLADGVVPQSVRTRIGKFLRDRGERVKHVRDSYYEDRGIPTVFDGRQSRAISVPNYYTEADERLGFTIDRTSLWRDALSVKQTPEEAEGTVFEAEISTTELEERLYSLAAQRLSVVRASIQRDYDIVFVWLAFVDSVGHLSPTIEEQGWQERHYRQAAKWTREIRESLQPEDTLVCVSDHGLRNGAHTHDPVIASDEAEVLEGVTSVLDVHDALNEVTPTRTTVEDEPVTREEYRGTVSETDQSKEAVRGRLEDLGYL